MNQLKPPKQVIVVEINKYYKAPGSGYGFNLAKLNDFAQQFKAKFLTLRMFKFDPFLLKTTVVGWPKKSSDNYCFYQHKMP